eukprot:scaffold249903_cov36-Tisochrysis_lutea.AAC.2
MPPIHCAHRKGMAWPIASTPAADDSAPTPSVACSCPPGPCARSRQRSSGNPRASSSTVRAWGAVVRRNRLAGI